MRINLNMANAMATLSLNEIMRMRIKLPVNCAGAGNQPERITSGSCGGLAQ